MVAQWIPQGPGVILGGTNVEGIPGQPQTGAVQAIAIHPTDPNIIYIGSVNGGVWKTTNATSANPTWTPLTDNLSSLSIFALDIDPNNPNTIVAGVDSPSAYQNTAGRLTGLLLTRDGGNSWTEIGTNELADRNVYGVAVRGEIIIAATDKGLYRSDNGSGSFEEISGSSNLPGERVYRTLTGDPDDPERFYIGVGTSTTPLEKLFRSDDNGENWEDVTPDNITSEATEKPNLKISVGADDVVYVGSVFDGQLNAIFRSTDKGENWTSLDLPATGQKGIGVHPGQQGETHFSFLADPNNSDIFYVGGDAQPDAEKEGGDPNNKANSIGAKAYSGRLFRGEVDNNGSVEWTPITNNFANPNGPTDPPSQGTSPHADSRNMAIDSQGNLIEVDDGGVYKRINPTSSKGVWTSLNNNLQITEFYSVDFDSKTYRIIGGSQDNGTSFGFYSKDGKASSWEELVGGDGGKVLVDDSNPEYSVHYQSYIRLQNFQRPVIDRVTGQTDNINPQFIVQGTGQSIFKVEGEDKNGDPNMPWLPPIQVNKVDSLRFVTASNVSVYESYDQGNTLFNIYSAGGDNDEEEEGGEKGNADVKAIAYGGKLNGEDNPDVLYVADSKQVLIRTQEDEVLTATATPYPGGEILDLILDPDDWRKAYVLDAENVYRTTDAGESWETITGNIFESGIAKDRLQTIEFIPGDENGKDALIVGGLGGVLATTSFDQGESTEWEKFGEGIPNTIVYDLNYDTSSDVLLAGTFGRGAWTIADAGVEFGNAKKTPLTPPPQSDGAVEIYIGNAITPENFSEYDFESDEGEDTESDEPEDTEGENPDINDEGEPPAMNFVVNLSEPSKEIITVDYTTREGSAISGKDFDTVSGTLTFAPGETRKTLGLQTKTNSSQGATFFFVDLSNAKGATIAEKQGIGNILEAKGVNTGNDFRLGTLGNDFIISGAGNDTVTGGRGEDLLLGNENDDQVYGNKGDDEIFGGKGNDTVWGGQDNDLAFGDLGNDLTFGDLGNDSLNGSQGDDAVQGNQGNDLVRGGKGNDVVRGGKDDDLVFGDKDNDRVIGDFGNDSVFGNEGNDTVLGGQGNDTVWGGKAEDFVRGGKGNDYVYGDLGNDTLYGDLGADTLTGGDGNDTFVVGRFTGAATQTSGGASLADADVIIDFKDGEDAIALLGGVSFQDLLISQGSAANASDTLIQDKGTNEFLAILKGVNFSEINQTDFRTTNLP